MTPITTRSVGAEIRRELPVTLKIAGPVVLAEIGWMAMGVIDTVMVGRLGAEAIGGVAIGNILFNTIGLLSFGLILGMDTLISQAFGAGKIRDCNHTLRQGLWLGIFVAPVLLVLMLLAAPTLGLWGVEPAVAVLAESYTETIAWSVFPLVFYFAFRRYLQSTNIVRPVMFTLLTANLVNAFGNWLLIFGHWGFPAYGVRGAAMATVVGRVYMAVVLLAVLAMKERGESTGLFHFEWPDWLRIRTLLHLGLPAAGHIFVEIAVFATATALAGKFTAVALAAHEVALNNASMTFMVPLGISSAAAVRVGQEIGRGDRRAAAIAGWTAILLGVGFMAISGLTMLAIPRLILGIYTPDVRVIETGVPLLFAAAAFQLFDGTQVVSTGSLRGLGDTRTPFYANITGYWVLGLPIGMVLCFRMGWEVLGLWVGLSIGLMIVAVVLLTRWVWASRVPSEAR